MINEQDENKIGIIEGTLRGAAGLGVGYSIFRAHSADYISLKKSFLGLGIPQTVKRAFTKTWQFSEEFFKHIEFEKSLDTPLYMQRMMTESEFKKIEAEVLYKRAQIDTTFARIDEMVESIRTTSLQEGANITNVVDLLGEYTQFRNNYYKRAMDLAEGATMEQFHGRSAALEHGRLVALRSDQLEALNQQLKVMRERTKLMEESLHTVKNDILGTRNRTNTKMLGMSERRTQELIEKKISNIEERLVSATDSVRSLSAFRRAPLSSEVMAKPTTKFWTITESAIDLRSNITSSRLIGREGVHSIAKMVKKMYDDPLLPKDIVGAEKYAARIIDERNTRREFMGYVRDTIRNLQRSGQFTKIELGITTDFEDSVLLKAIRRDGKEYTIPIANKIPQTELGVRRVRKGGKEFFQPFTKQYNILLEQAKMASYMTSDPRQIGDDVGLRIGDALDNIHNRLLEPSTTLLSDMAHSDQLNQRLMKEESEKLFHAYDSFQKISKNKMGRGNILHLNVSGEQVGWVLKDWKGRTIEGYHFAIGPGASSMVPTHLVGKRLNGHLIIQQIGDKDLVKVVDALSKTVERSYGKPLLVANASASHYDIQRLTAILNAVDKQSPTSNHMIGALKSAINKEHSVDITEFPRLMSETTSLKNTQIYEHIRKYIKDKPRLRGIMEHLRSTSFLPSFDVAGQMMVENMERSPYIRAARTAEYVELMYLSQKRYKKVIDLEMKKVKQRILPDRLTKGFPLRVNPDLRNLNLSPSSIVKGKFDTGESMLTSILPDLRPGVEYRQITSAQIGDPNSLDFRKQFQREYQRIRESGRGDPDTKQIVKKLLNEIHTKSVMMIDPGNTRYMMKDEFGWSDRFIRGSRFIDGYERIVVDIGTRMESGYDIDIGSEIHDTRVVGRLGSDVKQFNAAASRQHGIITDIINNSDGTETVVIGRINRIGLNSIVVVGNSQAATSTRVLEEYLPHIGGEYSSFWLTASAEKSNPGALMSGSLGNMFHHASRGNMADTKTHELVRIINRRFGTDTTDVRRMAFPVRKHVGSGLFEPDYMSREHWHKFFHRSNLGDIVAIAEEYKAYSATLGDAFTGSNLIIDEVERNIPRSALSEIKDSTFRSLGVFMGQPGFIEENVRIAHGRIGRDTSESAIKSRVKEVTEIFRARDIERAVALMRSDINISSVDDILKELPGYLAFGRTNTDGRLAWTPMLIGMPGFESITVRSQDVMSGLGQIRPFEFGLSTINQLSSLKDSKGLVDILRSGIYTSDPIGMFRASPLPFMTAKSTPANLKAYSLTKAAKHLNKFLDKWMSLPETTKVGNFMGWTFPDIIYEYNGELMTKRMASEKYGINSIMFEEAIRDGKANMVEDRTLLRSRLRIMSDIEQARRPEMQPFSIEFGRDARYTVEAKWGASNPQIERVIVTQAAAQDYYPIQAFDPMGKRHTVAIESLERMKLRDVLKSVQSGAFTNWREKNLGGIQLQGLVDSMTDYTFKLNMKSNQRAMMVPIVRFKQAMLFTDFPQLSGGVTTKAEALRVLSGMFGTEKLDRRMFLQRRGMVPKREGLISGLDAREVKQAIGDMFGSMTDADLKAYANHFLGNITLGKSSGMNANHYALQLMAGHVKVDGGALVASAEDRLWASNTLGMLHNIANSKTSTQEARKGVIDLISTGVTPATGFGAKYPTVHPGKWVGEDFYVVMSRHGDKENMKRRMSASSSPFAILPSAAMFADTNMDTDGDLIQLLMNEGKMDKILKIMKSNSFFSEISPIAEVIGTEKGTTMLYDHVRNEFITRPFGVTEHLAGFNKANTVKSEIWTKQAAGKVTIFAENIGHHMNRVLSGRGGGLATDLGQGTREQIRYQISECVGALIEGGVLKGKTGSSAGAEALEEFLERLGHESGVRDFAREVEAAMGTLPEHDIKRGMFKKLLTPIVGLREIYEGVDKMDFLDVMIQAAKSGKTLGHLTPEETIIGTALSGKDIRKSAQMIEAMKNILPELRTEFTPWRQTSMLNALKRNIIGERAHNEWWKNSKGMGWAATAGAVFLATNIFRPDDNTFLGHRPGRGGEERDWSFTRPEYEMAGLLNTPYKNPWDKKRTYITMDNPSMYEKMAKLSRRERRDLEIFHDSMEVEKTRSISSFDHRRTNISSYHNLLDRYGHV